MDSETPAEDAPNGMIRGAHVPRHNSDASTRTLSPADEHGATLKQTHRRAPKHVAGHSRLATRTMSSGRGLSKINLVAAAALRDDGGAQTARLPVTQGSPMMSPRNKTGMKRSSTSAALIARSASGSNIHRTVSGHQLHKATLKAAPKQAQARPDFTRAHSHPNKSKLAPLAPSVPRQNAVHFALGDDDDETEEMEGVDDGWTDSASPATTRDHTRSNTRSNSMTSDVRDHALNAIRDAAAVEKRLVAAVGASISGPRDRPSASTSSSPQKSIAPAAGSFSEGLTMQPPSADAIARRLIQRGQKPLTAPKLSDVEATASTSNPATLDETNASMSSTGSVPRISRFLGEPSTTVSLSRLDHDSTPPSRDSVDDDLHHDDRHLTEQSRNMSTPNLGAQFSPMPRESTASGSHTPTLMRPSRTQQKLWLQRGLSHIEAVNQQHAHTTGSHAGGWGALVKSLERLEKEYKVVRRYRNPVQESIDRLKTGPRCVSALMPQAETRHGQDQVNGTSPPTSRAANGTKSSQPGSFESRSSQDTHGPRSSASTSMAQSSSVPVSVRPGFSDEDELVDTSPPPTPPIDWQIMPVDHMDAATLDIRRRMWELVQQPDEAT